MKTKLIGSKNPALLRPLVPASRPPKSPTPKAEVLPLSIDSVGDWHVGRHTSFAVQKLYSLVRPFATKQQAMRAKRFWNLPYDGKVSAMCEAIFARYGGEKCVGASLRATAPHYARAILKLLGETEGENQPQAKS